MFFIFAFYSTRNSIIHNIIQLQSQSLKNKRRKKLRNGKSKNDLFDRLSKEHGQIQIE